MADKIIPITPEEKLLAKAGGQDIEIPTGNTRITKLLEAIAQNGSSGGGSSTDVYTRTQTDALLDAKADKTPTEEAINKMQNDISGINTRNSEQDTAISKVQSDITALQVSHEEQNDKIEVNRAALVDVVDSGRKNLIDTSLLEKTHHDVSRDITITSNGDGSLTISGKNTGAADIFISNINAGIYGTGNQVHGHYLDRTGSYIADLGVSDNRVRLQVQSAENETTREQLVETSSVSEFEYPVKKPYSFFRIYIAANTDFSDPLTIYPMICRKEIYDISQKIEPYIPSLAELTNEVERLQLKSKTITGTTLASGSLRLDGMHADNAVIIAAVTKQESSKDSAFSLTPLVTANGQYFLRVIDMSTFENAVSTVITVTVYYYDLPTSTASTLLPTDSKLVNIEFDQHTDSEEVE